MLCLRGAIALGAIAYGLPRSSCCHYRRRRRARHRRRRSADCVRRDLHHPCFNEAEAQRFALREHKQVKLTITGNLADEAAIARLYQSVGPLWASIHLAGGFAAGPLREASIATVRQQIDMNLMTCLLCCRAAIGAMTSAGGRIVNVAARPALEWRSGAGMVAYAASKAAV